MGKGLVLATAFLALAAGTALAQAPAVAPAPAPNEIVTLPDVKPTRPQARQPNARQLVESWLGGFIQPEGTHFDRERYEILSLRFGQTRPDTALMHIRFLPLEGDAVRFAGERCKGRTTPLEAQLYFQWSTFINEWVMHAGRGVDGVDPCGGEPLWSAEQVEKVIAPPPWPTPPKITKRDVKTPPAGSPERKAILDALRPSFEARLKPPVEFKVEQMRVAAGFAWVSVHPQRPGGREIAKKEWNASIGACEYDQKEANAQAWMHLGETGWEVAWGGVSTLCATDSIAGQGWVVGAPPQLTDIDSYGDDPMLFPVDDPQYFDLWWLRKK